MAWLLLPLVIATLLWVGNKGEGLKAETTQDLVGGNRVQVYPNGIIESGNLFRLMIEVQLANLSTASIQERKQVWSHFFTLLNTIGIPVTLLLQSQVLEMKDYTAWYDGQIQSDELTEPLRHSGQDVKAYLTHSTEETNIRDYRGYIMLQYDPVAASVDSGVQTGVSSVDGLLNRREKMSPEERRDLAQQVLEEMAELVYDFCEQAHMKYQRLDRAGVYDVDYGMLQRELCSQVRMVDALSANVFQSQKRSWEECEATIS
jgi:hypothetical protein